MAAKLGLLILLGAFGVLSATGAAHAATIVALGASNTFGKGVSRNQAYPAQLDNTPAIQSRLSAMGIKVVMLPNGMLHGLPHQPDGQHLTPDGYHMLAEELVGQVAAALGR